jgi:hypothetical protein
VVVHVHAAEGAPVTLESFLSDYVPRVLRPMKGWTVDSGAIRRVVTIGGSYFIACCPLTAEARLYSGCWDAQGERLGLSFVDRMAVVNAADGEQGPIRKRLLVGLGLAA